jgi:hypothetical protein
MDPECDEERQGEAETGKKIEIAHDSMVTVRLSEPLLTIDTKAGEEKVEETHGHRGSAGSAEVDDTQESPMITMRDPNGNETGSPSLSESAESPDGNSRRGSDSSDGPGVNWEELEKTEEQEPRDEGSDDVRTPSF